MRDQRHGEAVIEVAHETLLRQWDVLAGWLQDERAALGLHRCTLRIDFGRECLRSRVPQSPRSGLSRGAVLHQPLDQVGFNLEPPGGGGGPLDRAVITSRKRVADMGFKSSKTVVCRPASSGAV